MIKPLYLYEDGVEEGKAPLNLNIFEYFPEGVIRSIKISDVIDRHEVEIKLDPWNLSGSQIDKIMTNIDAEMKQLFIERGSWVLFLRMYKKEK